MPVAGVSMLAGVSMQFSFIMPCQKWANKIAIRIRRNLWPLGTITSQNCIRSVGEMCSLHSCLMKDHSSRTAGSFRRLCIRFTSCSYTWIVGQGMGSIPPFHVYCMRLKDMRLIWATAWGMPLPRVRAAAHARAETSTGWCRIVRSEVGSTVLMAAGSTDSRQFGATRVSEHGNKAARMETAGDLGDTKTWVTEM